MSSTSESPRQFLTQVAFVFILLLVSLFNLTFERGDKQLWTNILFAVIGVLIPSPMSTRIDQVKAPLNELILKATDNGVWERSRLTR